MHGRANVTAINFDVEIPDDERRERLYAGQIFVYSPSPSMIEFVDFARSCLEVAFAPHSPLDAQRELAVEQFVEIFAAHLPRFIHHPESIRLIQQVIAEFGCDPDATFVDVPRMRVQTCDAYLTSGVGYTLHPHRDTWYSAPMTQINWWSPLYSFEPDSAMAFYPKYWGRPVANGSDQFDLYDWNARGRTQAAQQVARDVRKQPRPEERLELDHDFRVIVAPGGLIMFSGAHLHASVPNTSARTRFSVDFRTVHVADVVARRGATNVDSRASGTTLYAHRRGSDLAPFPDAVARLEDPNPPEGAILVYKPD
jgi:hypothetical protein